MSGWGEADDSEGLGSISALLQGLGHILLGISSTLRHVVEGAEQWQLQRQGRLHRY